MSATSLGNDAPASAARRLLRHLLFSEYLVLYLSLLYFVAVLPLVPEMASAEVLANILSDMLPLLVVAIGQTFVLIVAGIDLSVTSVLAMASVVGASVMTGDGGYLAGSPLAVPGAILAMLAVGLLIGAFNGLCITRFGMPPFIVTLTTMMFFSGAAIWYTTFHTETSSIAGLPGGFVAVGQGSAAGLPHALWVVLAVGIAAHLVLARTVLGRRLYACGQNRRTAMVSGVPVPQVIRTAFVISGGCAAVASILYTGRLETGTPILGQAILLDIIGAVVIGGTSLFGGKGKILWTVFGVLFLVLIDTSLKMLGMSLFSVFAIKGAVILAAAVIDALRTRFSARL
ncbi:ABC transporter permease [Azospirillum sp. SYSU D00513]|uniref:ABC transporter permease n=1 Tax=Azospirillum sp. SYSU D00513 TaxID=2812561 RepID=UPI001A9573F7|nr:ABC transporter permease [Azospirillum sp. SYSU D00513]